MSEKNIKNVRIVHKHDVAANWLKATTFVPKQGELIVYDIDDNYDYERFKIGDGTTLVNDLPFYACSWNDLLDRPFGDNEDGTVSKLDDKYLNPVGQTSFGHTLVIGDIHQYPYVDFTSSKRWYKVSDNTPTDFTGMTLESNSPDMSPGDEITMIMYDGYACSNTASATNAYVLFVAYGNKIYQTEVLGPGIYVQENITYWEGDYIGSITLPNHEFTKSVIKEEYIPDTIARVSDIPDGGVQADMAQNDSAEPDYIKNRTHWIEENIIEAVPETTLESNGYIYGSILSISSGTRCIVTWEGEEYVCTARRDPNGMYKALVGDMTGNEPFELSIYMSGYVGPPGLCAKAKSSDGVVEGKIISIKIDKSVVHKLDTKYLPDNLAYMPKKSSVFLSSADWTGEGNLWSQPVIITAATATSKIDLLPTASQIVSLQSEEISLMIENDNGELTAYAIGGRPSTFYTMDVLLTEVVLV